MYLSNPLLFGNISLWGMYFSSKNIILMGHVMGYVICNIFILILPNVKHEFAAELSFVKNVFSKNVVY